MARLTARRALYAVPVLLVVTFGVFAVAAASPFDPVKAYAGTAALGADQETLDRLRENLGVDRPFTARWWDWLTSALGGDFGHSTVMRQPVAEVIGERLVWSTLLCAVAFAAAVLLGTVLGVLAARRPGSFTDRAATPPPRTSWRPPRSSGSRCSPSGSSPSGWTSSRQAASPTRAATASRPAAWSSTWCSPAGVLAVSQLPWFTLYVRQGVGDALMEDPVRGARARGLSERTVLLGHALRSGLLPVLTLIGSRVPELITGALLVETVFSWPGIASATVEAATAVDFPLLAALTTLATAAVLA